MKITEILNKDNKLFAIALTSIFSWFLTLVGIYGFNKYGLFIFVILPIFIGLCPVMLYGRNKNLTRMQATKISFQSLLIYSAGLFIFAIEGAICLLMAAPLGIILTWVGSTIGYQITNKIKYNITSVILLFLIALPTMGFIEPENKAEIIEATTSITINAPAKKVWQQVIQFPQLKEPTEFIFKTGIAYPINAKIKGHGVGAIRYCNFSTGSFVEPITHWEEPKLLQFDVEQTPNPMKELSFWDVDAPHLHDYFVSKHGQFKLTEIDKNTTLLEGTTWYSDKIKPVFYWKLWSNYIIHKIHQRVLNHIKENSEKA